NYASGTNGNVNNNLYLQPRWGYEVRLTAPGTTGGNSTYQDLRAKNLYANVLQNNGTTSNNHVYIRPINSGELRVTAPDSTDNFRNIRANNIYLANIVKPAEGDLYVGTSGKVRIMGRGLWEDSNYRPIVSSAFQNPSMETFKTNIRRYEDDALSIIDNAEIYNYELKSDVREGKNETHTGLIIGDDYQTPDCIKSDDNSSIDLYAMSSVGWKAIQELSQETKDLRSEIDILRRELNNE
ncbi:MAG: tail fiber domain-containing protein, partial [Tetragenococcus koreensis]|nr:tail fiber domain-containing protein [Tetragenococcus koreensis]